MTAEISDGVGTFSKRLIPLMKAWQRRYSQAMSERLISVSPNAEDSSSGRDMSLILRLSRHERGNTDGSDFRG